MHQLRSPHGCCTVTLRDNLAGGHAVSPVGRSAWPVCCSTNVCKRVVVVVVVAAAVDDHDDDDDDDDQFCFQNPRRNLYLWDLDTSISYYVVSMLKNASSFIHKIYASEKGALVQGTSLDWCSGDASGQGPLQHGKIPHKFSTQP